MIDISARKIEIIPKKLKLEIPVISFRDGIEPGADKPEEGATNSKILADNSPPTGEYKKGDVWFDTNDDNHPYRANEDKDWVSMRDGTIVAAAGTANWSEVVDDDTNKPEDNATEGADLATNVDNAVAENVSAARNFESVVDAAGTGDYTTIAAAIAAGKKNIFVRAGTYTISSTLIIPKGVSLIGEDKHSTILDITATTYGVLFGFTTVYTTGTITATNDSTTIVGVGTSWVANLAVDDYIIINSNSYKIITVTDNTHIEIESAYQGLTVAGASYSAGSYVDDIVFKNFTITGLDGATAISAFYIQYTVKSSFTDIVVKNNSLAWGASFTVSLSYNNTIKNVTIENSKAGIYSNYADSNTYENIYATNNAEGAGLTLFNSNNNILSNLTLLNNFYGIYLNQSSRNSITNFTVKNNEDHGVFIYTNTSNENKLSAGIIQENGQDGIRIERGKRNIILNCLLRNNSQDTNDTYTEIHLTDSGGQYSTHNIINANQIICDGTNKSKYGIRENSSSDDYNIITSNIAQGAVTTNISVQGVNSVNANNI